MSRHATTECQVCSRTGTVTYNFGAVSCTGCAAFFRRTVRSKRVYECKQNRMTCDKLAITNLSALYACKKCRLERCLQAGMNTEDVREARPKAKTEILTPDKDAIEFHQNAIIPVHNLGASGLNLQLPIISKMVVTLKRAFYVRSQRFLSERVYGTSEPWPNQHSVSRNQVCFLKDVKIFRDIFNGIPFVGCLPEDVKEVMFRNAMVPYKILMSTMSHLWQDDKQNPNRFYVYPKTYMERDFESCFRFSCTYKSENSLVTKENDVAILASNFVQGIAFYYSHIIPIADKILITEEDLAAMVILLIIISNDFNKQESEWQKALHSLKAVWKELDLHYKMTHRDPAEVADLIFLMSNIQTNSEHYVKSVRLVHLYFGNSLLAKLEKEKRVEDVQLE